MQSGSRERLSLLTLVRSDWRQSVAIDLDILKAEREKLKEGLREVEGELRKLEAQLKVFRQREIQTKREIEAVSTLIDIKDVREPKTD